MKKILIAVIAIIMMVNGFSQDMGIGIRLGDPSGVTFKKYMNENALEISVGRTKFRNRKGYYEELYRDWNKEKNFGYKKFKYERFNSSTPIAIQIHYLFNNDIDDVEGLQWYYGFGGQFVHQTYSFDYKYKFDDDKNWRYATGERVTDVDLGIDGVIGLEYTFDDAPISIFLDAILFMEIVDNPFVFWYQGGFGVRYNF